MVLCQKQRSSDLPKISEAREMSLKFKSLLMLFATFHFVYDSADQLDSENIDKLV